MSAGSCLMEMRFEGAQRRNPTRTLNGASHSERPTGAPGSPWHISSNYQLMTQLALASLAESIRVHSWFKNGNHEWCGWLGRW